MQSLKSYFTFRYPPRNVSSRKGYQQDALFGAHKVIRSFRASTKSVRVSSFTSNSSEQLNRKSRRICTCAVALANPSESALTKNRESGGGTSLRENGQAGIGVVEREKALAANVMDIRSFAASTKS